MSDTRTYRCLNCQEHTLTREYDVSHLSITCEACGEFSRFVHQGVYDQFEAFEENPPAGVEWETLSRMQKFVVVDGLVRSGKSLDDFDIDADGESPDTQEK